MDYKHLLSGAGAGIVTKTLTSPFDRIKILYQTDTKTVNRNVSIIQNIKHIYKTEGLLSFYRGNGANILKIVPNYSLKFSFNEYYKKTLYNKTEDLTLSQLTSVGILTGSSLITTTYPLDILRTRFAVSSKNQSFYNYSKSVLQNEGLKGFYKGFGVSLVTGSIHVGFQMTSYDMYKSYLNKQIDSSISTNLLCGAGAGLTALILTFPGDVIRKKLHVNGKLNETKLYENTFDCLKKTVQRQGIRNGLYSGLGISVIKTIPSSAIQFASFDFFKSMLSLW